MFDKMTIRDVALKDKKVLVRCDFNVPLKDGVITDETRILGAMPTIEYLVEKGARVILCSHMGKPKGEYVPSLSLSPVAVRLGELLGKPVEFVSSPRVVDAEVQSRAGALKGGEVMLLENTRFRVEETQNGEAFSRDLADLAEIFVNDAFGTAHRAHSSTVGVAEFLRPAVSGFLIEKELAFLGKAVEKSLAEPFFPDNPKLNAFSRLIADLPRKTFPDADSAENNLSRLKAAMKQMVAEQAPHPQVRTLECDIFGAEETVTLAQLARDGRLEAYYASCLPAEIQVLTIGPWNFVGWSGEIFVEYGLSVKRAFSDTFVISLANGEFQGYIVTPEAAEEGGYEASNSLFTPEAGDILVRETLELLKKTSAQGLSK